MLATSSQTQVKEENDGSDYDELHDDDAGDEFHIPDVLPVPVPYSPPIERLHKDIHRGLIDLDPPYQRDVVWPEAKQMKLIESIYRNYYVPPIIFTVMKEGNLNMRRCVDGKQRLTSIQKFIDGQIPYKDPITKKMYWFVVSTAPATKHRLEVPQYWKKLFLDKQLTCVDYKDLPDSLERDIFQRVQLGMPLTVAEKLQAISSPRADYISRLTQIRLTSSRGLAGQIALDTSRARDFQVIAQFVYCCDELTGQPFPTQPKLEQWLCSTAEPTPRFKDDIKAVMERFHHLAVTDGLDIGFKQIANRVAPVEFVFIGILLFVMKECGDKKCAQEVLHLRQSIREQFVDVRTNNTVVRALWKMIAQIADKYDTDFFADSADIKKTSTKSKRPRPQGEESDDAKHPAKKASKAQKSR